METSNAGTSRYENSPGNPVAVTGYAKRWFDTDILRISGTSNTSPPHDHGGGEHMHFNLMYQQFPVAGSYAAENFENSQAVDATSTIVTVLESQSSYNSNPPADYHKHTFDITNLNSETTPPAFFFYPYMRVN